MRSDFDVDGYEIEGLLSAGPIGETWLARDEANGEQVALRRIRPRDATAVDQARRLVERLNALGHPRLRRVKELLPYDGELVLVVDHAEGGSVEQLLLVRGVLDPGEVVTIASTVARALAAAHERGLVHGHLTPDSILFSADGQPVLADLGLAKLAAPDDEPSDAYADPAEAGESEPSPAGDVYSLAAICYTALTGLLPRAGERHRPIHQVSPGVPPGLAHAIEAGMQRAWDMRPHMSQFGTLLTTSCPAVPVRLPDSTPVAEPTAPDFTRLGGDARHTDEGGAAAGGLRGGGAPGREAHQGQAGSPHDVSSADRPHQQRTPVRESPGGPGIGGPGVGGGPGAPAGQPWLPGRGPGLPPSSGPDPHAGRPVGPPPPGAPPRRTSGPPSRPSGEPESAERDSRRPPYLLSGVVLLVIAVIVGVVVWRTLSGTTPVADPTATPTRTATPKPTPTPTPSVTVPTDPLTKQWFETFKVFDQRRSNAFAHRDPDLLLQLYAPHSPSYQENHQYMAAMATNKAARVIGLRRPILRLTLVSKTPTAIRFEALRQEQPYTMVMRDGRRLQCPGGPVKTVRIEAVPLKGTTAWRISKEWQVGGEVSPELQVCQAGSSSR
ncbi:serine/threonine protein kinase [Actinopolymorpha pittospori]